MVNETLQRCVRCQTDLPLSAYRRNRSRPDSYCRTCRREYELQWRRARGIGPRSAKAAKAPKTPKPRTYSTTYRAVHKQVQRTRGRASAHTCAHCTSTAAEWAYDHTDPAPLVGTTARGRTVQYSINPDRYLPLCKPCHARLDAP